MAKECLRPCLKGSPHIATGEFGILVILRESSGEHFHIIESHGQKALTIAVEENSMLVKDVSVACPYLIRIAADI